MKLFPGKTKGFEVLKGAIKELERLLGLERKEDRAKVLLRLDGGFGTDDVLNWLLWRGYQLIGKGYSWKRAKKVTSTVPKEEWEEGPTPSQKLGPRPSRTATGGGRNLWVGGGRTRRGKSNAICSLRPSRG